jgi:hypothetical protein
MTNSDLDPLLSEWPFDPSQVNARLITSADGTQKVQLRLDLGILQMHLDGRPDGQRPHGFECWLTYYKDQLNKHTESGHDDDTFVLDSLACHRLQQEAIQFYHRYLALFQLKDWHRVIRDTRRNLRAADFLATYAETEDQACSLLQFKPYMLMMNCRASAILMLENQQHIKAIDCVRSAIAEIENFLKDGDMDAGLEDCSELNFLREWIEELESTRPISQRERVERLLAIAISKEQYEKAAELRDQLARLAK